jgi:hypothetical protein
MKAALPVFVLSISGPDYLVSSIIGLFDLKPIGNMSREVSANLPLGRSSSAAVQGFASMAGLPARWPASSLMQQLE